MHHQNEYCRVRSQIIRFPGLFSLFIGEVKMRFHAIRIIYFIAAFIFLAADNRSAFAEEYKSLRLLVAQKYGLEEFNKIKGINFTFNVEKKGKKIKRTWQWEPKTEKVTYWGKDAAGNEIKYVYSRNDLKEIDKPIDHWFINDQYWLLFPFHLIWDEGIEITEDNEKKYPISQESGRLLSVKYLSKKGYTPGDIYELYVDEDNLIKEWIYRQGGGDPTLIATWEENKKFGPIIISTEHKNANNTFKLWFSDVSVELY